MRACRTNCRTLGTNRSPYQMIPPRPQFFSPPPPLPLRRDSSVPFFSADTACKHDCPLQSEELFFPFLNDQTYRYTAAFPPLWQSVDCQMYRANQLVTPSIIQDMTSSFFILSAPKQVSFLYSLSSPPTAWCVGGVFFFLVNEAWTAPVLVFFP